MLTEEPYLGLTSTGYYSDMVVPGLLGTVRQVLHGCRRLVPVGVGLSLARSATPISRC